ncbi:ferrochelatase [Terriglobus albidus]|uniref:Ferrochelatase n=1 Tax=Terriglobus albidus TaxID=1592106 RepID=A0A5B9E7I4_9BACT|nr:ferrochelatase [Terriglobus albidus]QEE27729.1 ferrochelatase [Terriglobus albidus]
MHAILLLAHGTPDTLGEMKAYLDLVTSGRGVPDHVVEELQHRYAEIGLREEPGPEPPHLTRWTMRQAELLRTKISEPVYVAMRNWKPLIAPVIEQMKADGVTSARVLCLAPQNSRTSIGLYKRDLVKALGETPAIQIDFVEGWHNHPKLIEAFADRLLHTRVPQISIDVNNKRAVLFTAHSVPSRTVQGDNPDPYADEAKDTAALVAQKAGINDWYFAFQSQGASGGPWLGPTVEDSLRSLKDRGYDEVVLHPIGFVCDHVEVLYDIDINFQQFAKEIGIRLSRPESLNDHPLLIEALADLAGSRR